jgi:5-methylcytosine-specific restriction endonuclease McrA
MDHPKTRAEAKAAGAKFYFTGEPCVRGHIALRKTKGACVDCMREDWALDNERRKTKPKTEASKAAGKRYYERNKEAVIARAAARPPEEKRRLQKQYKDQNIDATRADTSVRRRRHREATPAWLTPSERLAMRQLYIQARKLTEITGERYVVDHIVPLRSHEVCGLHVPWNLRVITQEENLKKSNKLVAPQETP